MYYIEHFFPGEVKVYRSCGIEGFKNTRKGTNIAAQATAISFSSVRTIIFLYLIIYSIIIQLLIVCIESSVYLF